MKKILIILFVILIIIFFINKKIRKNYESELLIKQNYEIVL